MKLNNQVAVITGGSGQIGKVVAHRLAEQGARIYSLVRRNLEIADQLIQSLPNQHLQHQALLVDVKDAEQIKKAADTVSRLAGRCDLLINSAAISLHTADPMQFPEEQFDEIVAVNLKGPWLMTKEFYPMLKATGDGLVINISSVSSVRTRPDSTFYSMTKSGLNAMSQSLAKSLGPEVRVIALAPSMLPEPVSGYPFATEKKSGAFGIEDAAKASPIKRICTAEDVADMIESLATNIKFYNGHVIMLDGGATL